MDSEIKELFADIIEVPADTITDDTSPDNTESWDSYRQMFLIASFEEKYEIAVEPEEIIDMYVNYKNFEKIILRKVSEK